MAWSLPLRKLSAGLFRSRTPQPHLSRGPDEFFRHRTRSSSMLFYDDGPTASIAVREHPRDPIGGREIAILSNGKSDGSSASDYRTMSLAALVPALFADGCERAFVVGYGTGVTAAELAALDCFDEVVVAEIADGVIEAAPIFDPVNMGASRDPKIRIVRSVR